MSHSVRAAFDRTVSTPHFDTQLGGDKVTKEKTVTKTGHMVKRSETDDTPPVMHDVRVVSPSEDPSCWQTFLQYLSTVKGLKNLLKGTYLGADWARQYNPSLVDAAKVSALGKQTKNLASVTEIPESAIDTVQAAARVAKKPDVGSFGNFTYKVGRLLIPVIEAGRVVCDVVSPLTASVARTVSSVFSGALVFTTLYSTGEELEKIGAEKARVLPTAEFLRDRVVAARDASVTQSWLKIATNLSYMALGVLGLATLATSVVVPSWVFLSFATSGFACSVLAHFQKKLSQEPALAKASGAFEPLVARAPVALAPARSVAPVAATA